MNHFIRGYIDGDGSFFVTKELQNSVKKLNFSVCGTENCLNTFSNVFIKNGINISKHLIIQRNIYILHARGNRKVLKIRDFLYNGTEENTLLERKRDILFDNFFDNMPYNFKAKSVLRIIGNETKTYKSITTAAADGFTASAISKCCRGKMKIHKGYKWRYAKKDK